MWNNWLGTDEELENPGYREGVLIGMVGVQILIVVCGAIVYFLGVCPSG